jgi:hypothetical protein
VTQAIALHHGRVVLTGEITSPEYNDLGPTDDITPRYSNYLCFTASIRANRLGIFQDKCTLQQDELHNLIKSLHDDGMGYSKIAYYLNDKGIRTSKDNPWKNNQVYSVLHRYRERQERLVHIDTDYPPIWGKMELRWEKIIGLAYLSRSNGNRINGYISTYMVYLYWPVCSGLTNLDKKIALYPSRGY